MKKNINFKRMINFKYKFLLLLFALYFGNKSYAQFVNIDSCLLVLKASKEDTNKVILLDKIAWDISYNNLQKGLDYSILSFELAKKLNYKRKFSNIYNTQGAIYTDMAQHGKAIAAYLEGIKYAKLFKLKKSEAVLLNNLANLFSNNNEKRKALAYYFSSIECSKNIGEPAESTTAFGNIPTVYSFYEKYDSALYYLNKSINYNLIHNRMDFLLTNYTMLSEINYSQGDKINALLSANKAVNIANKLKDSFSLTRAKIAQSNAYSLNKNIPMAITLSYFSPC